jgi:hypothetical protein
VRTRGPARSPVEPVVVNPRRILAAAIVAATTVGTPVLASTGHGTDGHGTDGHGHGGWVAPPDDHWAGHGVDPTNPAACDPLDPAQCMLPYPNDWFTKPDPTSATGRRLDLDVLGMPRNVEGKPIEPQEWNRSDGFSAGAQILTYVPGMTSNADLVPSGLPPVTDLGMNDSPNDLGVVLLDTTTGRKWPVWAEIDQYTDESGVTQTGAVQQDLMIHPAVNLTDGHRYIVALRHLVLDNGSLAQPSPAFKAYRDGTAPLTDPRRQHMENLFATLAQAGVARSDLYLAWDFTTASTANVTGRLLAMRNDAFAQLGDTTPGDGIVQGHAPAFTVDSVTDLTPAQDSKVARRVTGHFTVPCYIAPTCEPPTKCDQVSQGVFNDCPTPGQFALDPTNPDAVPQQTPGQTYQANFICNVGRTAYEQHELLRPVEYGHGLFGSADEVNSDPQQTMADEHGMLYCATDWTGMATADVPNAVIALQDLSRFPLLTDRVQQGELNFLYLARLMVHPAGFSANPAFQWSDGTSFIDTRQAYYDGNSQGGIYGGTVCAVSIDVRHCTLGVPGMDYSILLPRSSDYVAEKHLSQFDPLAFDPTDPTGEIGYSQLLDAAYPDQSQRMLILDLIQTLWDHSDPDGYATHMTAGLPGTPTHAVLLQLAYGDHQVANITAETEARTIGARAFTPPVVEARTGPYKDPFWGLKPVEDGSYDGSAIALFDSGPASNVTPEGHHGTDWPPTADVPNRSGEDPHEAPRRAACGQEQKDLFLSVGGVATATCGGAPYFSWGWDGTTGL